METYIIKMNYYKNNEYVQHLLQRESTAKYEFVYLKRALMRNVQQPESPIQNTLEAEVDIFSRIREHFFQVKRDKERSSAGLSFSV